MQTLTLSKLFVAGCCLLLMPGMVLAQVRIQTQFLQFPNFPQFQSSPQFQRALATASISAISTFFFGADREPRLIVDASKKQHNAVQNSSLAAAIAYNTNPAKPESRGKRPGL